jgi:hypothetical protein
LLVDTDEFAQRLAIVRKRFAAKLATRIRDTEAALPVLNGSGSETPEAVDVTHRCIHELCGIGPSVGFDETGRAARVVERILLEPSRIRRALTGVEVEGVRSGLDALRRAAQADCAKHGFQWE